ncbi:MAG: phosphoribosylformylglycinamidine synthase subunit PurQ [Bifidobacterium pullorum]
MTAECPTLTFNTIGRHQSRLVRTRVALEPVAVAVPRRRWAICTPSPSPMARDVSSLPTACSTSSSQTGRLPHSTLTNHGVPSMHLSVNPNGSMLAIEGITSPDGRVFGKMGHSERTGDGLYVNVPGNKYQPIFEAGVEYFTA